MQTAEHFFYDHSGYSLDPKTQTPEEGRRECAARLAAAERQARDAPIVRLYFARSEYGQIDPTSAIRVETSDVPEGIGVLMPCRRDK